MNVYTFYENIDFINNNSNQEDLINLWRESWIKLGWKPIVLTKKNVMITEEEYNLISKIPTVNNIDYEMACYVRWKAMSQVGGGWMSDYDVINNGFTPNDADKYESLSILQGHVPCLVYGNSEHYGNIFDIFCKKGQDYYIEYNGKKHTSDMIIMMNLIKEKSEFIKTYNLVEDFPNESNLVHCSFQHCSDNSMTKLEAMKKILKK